MGCAELMKLLIWVTPAGTVDEGGVEQPSYLNFDTTLLAAPLGNEMQVCTLKTEMHIFPHECLLLPCFPLPFLLEKAGSMMCCIWQSNCKQIESEVAWCL